MTSTTRSSTTSTAFRKSDFVLLFGSPGSHGGEDGETHTLRARFVFLSQEIACNGTSCTGPRQQFLSSGCASATAVPGLFSAMNLPAMQPRIFFASKLAVPAK